MVQDQPAPMAQHQPVLMDLPPSSTETCQLVRALTTASLTTARTSRGLTPALMAAPLPSGGPGATAGVPRRTESAAMDQPRHLTETSPLLPALMEAIPSAPRMIVKEDVHTILITIDKTFGIK